MIIRNGNYHEEEPPTSPAPPVFHPTHLEGHNNLKEEESPTPIPTIDKSHQSDPTTALETRGDRQAQAEDVGWTGTQARSCLSVDSDSNGSSEPFLRQSRRKRFVKIKSRSERSRRSTSISTAGSADENETVTLRRTKRSTAGRNPNPYNLPRSASLQTTEILVQPSFGELSEAMSILGAELSSKLGSMLQTAWLQSQAATANNNHMQITIANFFLLYLFSCSWDSNNLIRWVCNRHGYWTISNLLLPHQSSHF